MADPSNKRRATYQDVLDAPEHLVAEIIDGELRLSPRPASAHAGATSTLGFILGPPFHLGSNGPGGWIILDEPELHLAADIVVPDLAGWRRERLPTLANEAFFTLAPDWICEMLSRSTEASDRAEELPIYAAAGVKHVWLVNALRRTLEVMRLSDRQWVLLAVHHGDVRVRAEPFEAIEIDLAMLWANFVAPPPRRSRASDAGVEYELDDPF